jgi:protein SCO1/2
MNPRRRTAAGGARPWQLPALAVVVGALLLAGCGGSGGSGSSTGVPKGQSKVASPSFAGSKAVPPKPAPPLKLKDSLGKTIDLKQFKGKAALITFIYTHCPDVCPLIVSHLKTAQAQLGSKAMDMQIIAVSTDPRGDNPSTVKRFLAQHGMTGKMDYLIGSPKQLQKTWADWNIIAKPDKTGRDLVEHSALIYGISASGDLTTLYPSNFAPAQIVHDVPILAQL